MSFNIKVNFTNNFCYIVTIYFIILILKLITLTNITNNILEFGTNLTNDF